jgi:hypothetical protein
VILKIVSTKHLLTNNIRKTKPWYKEISVKDHYIINYNFLEYLKKLIDNNTTYCDLYKMKKVLILKKTIIKQNKIDIT